VAQRGPVFYIARIAGPLVFTGTRHCTIPHQKSLFLYIGAVVDEYPCARPLGDPCITGRYQPAVVDGFFMMVKPLPRGEHTIVVHGTATSGDDKTLTYYLTTR
jgi:hypothetical protein